MQDTLTLNKSTFSPQCKQTVLQYVYILNVIFRTFPCYTRVVIPEQVSE